MEAVDPARLGTLIGQERLGAIERVAETARAALAGHAVVNINSTATGGGVAEMLQPLLAYVRGAGIDARWLVIQGDPEFFAITKRVHNGLYGSAGDGGALGASERAHYERVLARNGEQLLSAISPGDLVLVHDPQPAGLLPLVRRAGARAVWRCHVGVDMPNEWTDRAWDFIEPYVGEADAIVVSRDAFAPPFAPRERVHVIAPSIDPFSAKNEPLMGSNVRITLGYVGLLRGNGAPPVVPFTRRDGTRGRISRRVEVLRSGDPPPPEAALVTQASRWDGIKDMVGVMESFAEHVDPRLGAHLVLAGPAVHAVADDPEAALVYDECVQRWHGLPRAARDRIHLVCVPMDDPDEGAAIVNALQRHSSVVVQKSLAEGFGLTVTEAMWKARPIVASAVGGIVDQICDREHGLLVDDPRDLRAFGEAVQELLGDPELARRLGQNARRRALDEFVGDRHLDRYGQLLSAFR